MIECSAFRYFFILNYVATGSSLLDHVLICFCFKTSFYDISAVLYEGNSYN
jgi:hypothetical protein